ncbi:MAG TPA: rod shape-determining protein MreC [Chroococcales cyanobacterium]|jgi:rod shape-determining protein MreC
MRFRLPGKEIALALGLILFTAVFGWWSGRNAVLPDLLRPGLQVIQIAVNQVVGFAASLGSLERLREENDRLHRELTSQRMALAGLTELRAQNARLTSLAGLAALPDFSAAPRLYAQVIGRTPDNWFQRLLIDKGRADGVILDSPVISDRGLVGKVVTVGLKTSLVGLLTDPDIAVSCLNQRNRAFVTVSGQSSDLPVLRYLSPQADFRIGDLLVTSGLGQIFPKGIPVGKISRIEKPFHAIVPQISLLPSANLDRIEEVRLLSPQKAEWPPSRPENP